MLAGRVTDVPRQNQKYLNASESQRQVDGLSEPFRNAKYFHTHSAALMPGTTVLQSHGMVVIHLLHLSGFSFDTYLSTSSTITPTGVQRLRSRGRIISLVDEPTRLNPIGTAMSPECWRGALFGQRRSGLPTIESDTNQFHVPRFSNSSSTISDNVDPKSNYQSRTLKGWLASFVPKHLRRSGYGRD